MATAETTYFSGTLRAFLHDQEYGFIQPDTELPHPFNEQKKKDVYFHLSSLQDKTREHKLTKDAPLHFRLNLNLQPDKIRAQHVWFTDENPPGNSKPKRKTSQARTSIPKSNALLPTVDTDDQSDSAQAAGRDITFRVKGSPSGHKSVAPISSLNATFGISRFRGVVKMLDRQKGFGFIKVEDLPDFYEQKDVHFSLQDVLAGRERLQISDEVEFMLGAKQSPKAFKIKLHSMVKRPAQFYIKFLQELQSELANETSTTQSDVLKRLSELAVWKGMAQNISEKPSSSKFIWDQILISMSDLLQQKNEFKDHLHFVFKALLEDGLLLESSHSQETFRTLYSSSTPAFKETLNLFVLAAVQYVPNQKRNIWSALSPLLSQTRGSLESLFSELFKQSFCKDVTNIKVIPWNEIPPALTPDEVVNGSVSDVSQLSPVRTNTPYSSEDEYMNTYFRLLRYDAFASLQRGIEQFLRGKLDPRDMCIFFNVTVAGVRLTQSESALNIAVHFQPARPVKNWETSRNLMFGNLVCLSPRGNFQDAIFATVTNRELLPKRQIVLLEFCTESNHVSDTEAVYQLQKRNGLTVMAESPTYFAAYQPVLKALQKIPGNHIAFKEEIVQSGSHSSQKPSYLPDVTFSLASDDLPVRNFPDYMASSKSNSRRPVCIEEQLQGLQLDESQKNAMIHALTNRVAIIQGPPGTGKTFLGVQLVKVISKFKNETKGPIVVITYKNHALDEFLKEILNDFTNVVRVGGRSRDTNLTKCHIKEKRRSFRYSDLKDNLRDYRSQLDELKETIVAGLTDLDACYNFQIGDIGKNMGDALLRLLLTGCNWDKTKVVSYYKPEKNDEEFQVVSRRRSGKWNAMRLEEVRSLLENELKRTDVSILASNPALPNSLPLKVKQMVTEACKQWIPSKQRFEEIENQYFVNFAEEIVGDLQKSLNKEDKTSENDDIDDKEDIQALLEERVSATSTFQATEIEKELINLRYSSKKTSGSDEIHMFRDTEKLANDIPMELFLETDPWSMNDKQRVCFVQILMHNQLKKTREDLNENIQQYEQLCRMKSAVERALDVALLSSMDVVGMTMTGVSIHHKVLSQVKPSVVLVEEAAEVLEPQLIALLGPWVKHLIMIGDHCQLRPPVETYQLVREHHFDLSMMERLINNGLPHATLAKQNRMRPEISKLLQDIYPKLQDNMTRVTQNQSPLCVEKSVFFWNHDGMETVGRSYSNELEAEMAVKLTLFLIQHQYKPWEITILCAYQGQVTRIRSLMRKAQNEYKVLFADPTSTQNTVDESEEARPNRVVIQTIDNYQGDENEIVIVSLVRNNVERKVGFLKTLNRRCVAQSRAKCGMYLLGNKGTLCSVPQWRILLHTMEQDGYLGDTLCVRCPKHVNSRLLATSAKDLNLQSFCQKTCGKAMPCGTHSCRRKCQPYHDHLRCTVDVVYKASCNVHDNTRKCYQKETRCQHMCSSIMSCGIHACPQKCFPEHSHSMCGDDVTFKALCGHKNHKKCFEDELGVKCTVFVSFTFQSCGHTSERLCWSDEATMNCQEACSRIRPCKHYCHLKCYETCSSEPCRDCIRIAKEAAAARRKKEKELRRKKEQEIANEIAELQDKTQEVQCQVLDNQGDDASEYYQVHDCVMKYIQPGHRWMPKVTQIERITNPDLEIKFLVVKSKLKDIHKDWVLKFHGTSSEALDCIVKEGFKIPQKAGMYGAGVYFATDSSKSAQELYTKGSNKLLLCKVLLGKGKTVTSACSDMTLEKLCDEKYDSIYAPRNSKDKGGVLFDEYVLFRPEQALPKYIIHYTKTRFQYEVVGIDTLQRQAMANGKQVCHKILPKRSVDSKDPMDLHFRIAESQFLRLAARSQKQYQITQVDYYINPDLVSKFEKQQKDFTTKYGSGTLAADYIFAFHGTGVQNLDSIMKENFRLDLIKRTAHGVGIYFSEFPDISLGYGAGLILCKVLLGKSVQHSGPHPGYDSTVVAPDSHGRGQMHVIYNVDQILPCYVIYYS